MSDVRANSGVPVLAQFTGRLTPSACAPLVVDSATGYVYSWKTGDVIVALGTVTNASALTANQIVIGGGSSATATLGSLGTTTTVLHGNAGGAPTFGAVSLTADVSGVLPTANGGSVPWASYTTTRTSWTDVGSPTVTARFAQVGKICFFQIQVVPGVTTATVGGTSYVSLPVAASGLTGDASMMNVTTLVGVGNCVIDVANSRAYVPSQGATGNTLTIGGWFEY